ncbi:MAG: hypothetical protein ACK4YP_11545 [Myxococcota bacterium]
MFALLLTFTACSGAPPDDTGVPADTDEEVVAASCDALEIRVDGEDPPSVGDTWTTWLWCDDALMTGAYRVMWDPPEIATVSENRSEFIAAGEATLMVQVGSRKQWRDVTVGE